MKLIYLFIMILLGIVVSIGTEPQQQGTTLTERTGELSVATWNMEWFYDWDISDNQSETAKINSAPSRKDWEWRLKTTAEAISKLNPTILCLQEIENRKVLEQLSATLEQNHQLHYDVCFVKGRDTFTEQDVGVLVRRGLRPQVRRAPEPRNWNSRERKPLTKQIMLEIPWGEGVTLRKLTIFNVHLLAGEELGREMDRCDQARFIKRWIEEEHKRGNFVILAGDFNTAEVRTIESYQRALDVVAGKDTPDNPDDDLEDVVNLLPPIERITYGKRGAMLDHIFISPKLKSGPGIAFDSIRNRKDVAIRGKGPDFSLKFQDRRFWKVDEDERDLSDHYPLLAIFRMK
ncbi:MAG TPA: endonuclease/exonuclease/phosphatase family protein [Gemmatales bacterium]|nr:endonuclease/exonuclease/phosphatase family protein [Gemmatales bacterium]